MAEVSFKERVAQTAIEHAAVYHDVFVKYEYLICSAAFSERQFYILDAKPDNYRHLIGVSTEISAGAFFEKCFDGTLTENDFEFSKAGQSERDVKGSVRDKIHALPAFLNMFQDEHLAVQESFVRNRVHCSFATTDHTATIGFVASDKARPMTLLRGDKLDPEKSCHVDLVLRRDAGESQFDTIVIGNRETLAIYYDRIKDMLASELSLDVAAEPTAV